MVQQSTGSYALFNTVTWPPQNLYFSAYVTVDLELKIDVKNYDDKFNV
jgi:hypothetical protein